MRKHALWESLQVNDNYRLIMANVENEKDLFFALRSVEQCARRDREDIFEEERDVSSIEAEGDVFGWRILFWR